MTQRTRLLLKGALLGSVALTPVTALAAPTLPTCSQLANLLKTNSYISQTASDNEGLISPTATIVPATSQNAAYCAVHLQFSAQSGPTYGYAPGESQTIGIGVGLPLNSVDGGAPSNPLGASWTAVNGAWNGRQENFGGGGNTGSIGSTVAGTNGGYVGTASDGGHNSAQNGTLANFGVIQATHQLDLGKLNDYVVEATHQQYIWGRWLADKYYGQVPLRNYWNGCSTGGRQAFQLAESFGYDFDGILAGAPAINWQAMQIAAFWGINLINRDNVAGVGDTLYTAAQYNAATASAIAACDVLGTDTVTDGVVDDPRLCTFSATNNICGNAGAPASPNCLDAIQAAAIDKVWDGPRNHDGRRIWHPTLRVNTPVAGGSFYNEDIAWDHRDLTFSGQNVYSTRALAAANPLGEPHPIALEDEIVLADTLGGPGDHMKANNFQALINNLHTNGRPNAKMILWQGGADPQIYWQDSIEAYREVATLYGGGTTNFGTPQSTPGGSGLQSWFRYYHAPGVAHCGNGNGASPATTLPDGQQQIFDDLVKWVETGTPPQSAGDSTHLGILGTSATNPAVGTRPVCPWPTTAIYNGSGSTTVASNYTCGGNLDAATVNGQSVLCQGLRTIYGQESSNSLDYAEQGVSPSLCPNP
jgi:Tannase and feruloyl esterase